MRAQQLSRWKQTPEHDACGVGHTTRGSESHFARKPFFFLIQQVQRTEEIDISGCADK